jgi:hypothetical protein
MAKRVQDTKPARKLEAQTWIKENLAEQKKRYAAIVKEQDELGPQREKWVERVPADHPDPGLQRQWRHAADHQARARSPKQPKGMKKHQVVF